MKKLFVIFFLLSCTCYSQSKEEVIDGFLNKFKKNYVVQYQLQFSFNDESKGGWSKNVICAEMIVPADTAIGAYTYFSTDSSKSIRIYAGNINFDYSPELYGDGNVKILDRKKNPERFSDMPVNVDGMTGYVPSVATSSGYYETSMAHLRKLFKEKDKINKFELLKDTTINGIECFRLKMDYLVLEINKISLLPYHYLLDYKIQKIEAFYSDFKINKIDKKYLFTKKAFPKNFRFASNFKSTDKYLREGTKAPDFEINSITEKKVRLEDLRGKSVLMYVTEIGCPPCMMALPEINDLTKKYKDLIVLGIYPLDSKSALEKLAKDKSLVFDIYYKAVDVKKKYGIGGYPTFFIVDKDGVIRFSGAGYGVGYKDILIKQIEKVLKM